MADLEVLQGHFNGISPAANQSSFPATSNAVSHSQTVVKPGSSPVTPEEQIFNVDPQSGDLCQGMVTPSHTTSYSTLKTNYNTPKPSPYNMATPVSVRKPVPNQYLRTVDSKQSLRSVKSNLSFSVPRKPAPALRSPLQSATKLTDSPMLSTTRSSLQQVTPLSLISSPVIHTTQPLVIPPSTPSSHGLRGSNSFNRGSESHSASNYPASEFGGRKKRSSGGKDSFSPAFVVGKSQSAMCLPLSRTMLSASSSNSSRASFGSAAPESMISEACEPLMTPKRTPSQVEATLSSRQTPPLNPYNTATNISPLKSLSNASPRRRPEPLTSIRNPLRAPSIGHSQVYRTNSSDYFGSHFDNSVFVNDGRFSATSSTFSDRSLSSAGSIYSVTSTPSLENPFPGVTKAGSEPPSSGEALFPGANVFPGINFGAKTLLGSQACTEPATAQSSPVSSQSAEFENNDGTSSLVILDPISAGTPIAPKLLWEKVGQSTEANDSAAEDNQEVDKSEEFVEEDTIEYLYDELDPHYVSPRPSLYRDAVAQINEPQISRVVNTGMGMFPLKIVTAVDADIEKNQASVALQFQVPNRSGRVVWLGKNYCSSVKDIERSYSVQRRVKSCSVNGRKLDSVKTGPLRFESRASILQPKSGQYLCSDAEVMLFSELLVIFKDNRVIAAIDVNAHLRKAKVHKIKPRVLKLRFKVSSTRRSSNDSSGGHEPEFTQGIDLKLSSPGEAFAWECAVSDRKQEFPLCADVKPGFLAKLESDMEILHQHGGKTTERLSSEIAICIPRLYLVGDAKLGRRISDIIRDTLCPEDRVSVLVYSEFGEVIDSMPLQAPQWPGWERYLGNLSNIRADSGSIIGVSGNNSHATMLDTVIFGAKNMLHSKQYRSGTASIILITNDRIELGSTLAMFQSSDIAVCPIDLSSETNRMALTSLAHATGGNYLKAADSQELYSILRATVINESRYVFRDLVAHLRPRLGAQITAVHRNDYHKWPTPVLGNGNQPLKIRFGALRAGDTKSVVIDMAGNFIPSQPLFQAGVEVELPTQAGDNSLKKLCNERILTPSTSDHKNSASIAIINTEKIIICMHSALSSALKELNQGHMEKAHAYIRRFHSRGRDLAQVVVEHEGSTSEVRCVIDVLLQEMITLDELCTESSLSAQDLSCLTLQYLWLIEERRGVLQRDNLETIFL